MESWGASGDKPGLDHLMYRRAHSVTPEVPLGSRLIGAGPRIRIYAINGAPVINLTTIRTPPMPYYDPPPIQLFNFSKIFFQNPRKRLVFTKNFDFLPPFIITTPIITHVLCLGYLLSFLGPSSLLFYRLFSSTI